MILRFPEKNISDVGLSKSAAWGGDGSGPAPRWLAHAVAKGWNNPRPTPPPQDGSALFSVNVRDGLNLRTGPGQNFRIIKTLPLGTLLTVKTIEGSNQEWAQVDLEGDGVSDGYVFRSFLQAVQSREVAQGGSPQMRAFSADVKMEEAARPIARWTMEKGQVPSLEHSLPGNAAVVGKPSDNPAGLSVYFA